MDSIKLITDTRDFYMSCQAGEFDFVNEYLRDQGYRTLLTADETEEFRRYLTGKLESLLRTFEASSRRMLGRMKLLNYRGNEIELNLSDHDHYRIYWLHEMVCALTTTKGLKIEYNDKA